MTHAVVVDLELELRPSGCRTFRWAAYPDKPEQYCCLCFQEIYTRKRRCQQNIRHGWQESRRATQHWLNQWDRSASHQHLYTSSKQTSLFPHFSYDKQMRQMLHTSEPTNAPTVSLSCCGSATGQFKRFCCSAGTPTQWSDAHETVSVVGSSQRAQGTALAVQRRKVGWQMNSAIACGTCDRRDGLFQVFDGRCLCDLDLIHLLLVLNLYASHECQQREAQS